MARQEKLKNLEKYGTKLGKSTKLLAADDSSQDVQKLPKKRPEKSKLRPGMAFRKFILGNIFNNNDLFTIEYNPLMGDSSAGVCFRPSRRGGAGGG